MDQHIPQVRPIPTNHPRTHYNSDNRKQGTETFDYQDNGMEDFSSSGHGSASFCILKAYIFAKRGVMTSPFLVKNQIANTYL